MRTYRNTITGVIVTVSSEVKGNWKLVSDSLSSDAEPKKEEKPVEKKPTARKRTAKK